MPALITKCAGASLVKISIFVFNLDVSDLHAAKEKKGNGLLFLLNVCVCVSVLQAGFLSHSFKP